MQFITETSENKQSILIIDRHSSGIGQALKEELRKHDVDVFFTTTPPISLDKYEYIFIIDDIAYNLLNELSGRKRVILLFTKSKKLLQAAVNFVVKRKALWVKIISLLNTSIDKDKLDKILWFAFSKSNEYFLNLQSHLGKPKKKKDKGAEGFGVLSKKGIIVSFITLIIIFYLSVIPLISTSLFLFYKSSTEIRRENIEKARNHLAFGNAVTNLTNPLYKITRPVYSFFSLSVYSDNLYEINTKTSDILETSINLQENSNRVITLLFKKNKSTLEQSDLDLGLSLLANQVNNLEKDTRALGEKIPDYIPGKEKFRSQIQELSETLEDSKKIVPHLKNLLAKDTQKKYLLLFANNMEIRPGGGFIGSFGVLTLKNLTVENIEIYDVYDADGQLTDHVEPPEPIRKHLNQPNWFLRDSAFAPDFSENYNWAKYFLDQELGLRDFAGGILLTTSTIQNLLEAYDGIYLTDVNEQITKENFYIKAQTYAESEFFPGSTQKKSFLGSLMKHIIVNLPNARFSELSSALKRSLDEKQLVLMFEDKDIQKQVDSLYWSGKILMPNCPEDNCISDYILQTDANLGVNKANFFVSRTIDYRVFIDPQGKIKNTYVVKFKNESPNMVFPGGVYKNYFQIALPRNSQIREITQSGVLIEEYDIRESVFKNIGFLSEIFPQDSGEIKVDYEIAENLKEGRQLYQLVIQKQIGSKNSDLNLEIILPNNIHILNQNFTPIVKNNRIFYNTSLNADKIFLLEFVRERN